MKYYCIAEDIRSDNLKIMNIPLHKSSTLRKQILATTSIFAGAEHEMELFVQIKPYLQG